MVVCGMGNVGPWVFDELLNEAATSADEWQVSITSNGRYDVLDLCVEQDHGADICRIRSAVLAALRTRFPDFWKNLEMGLYELHVTAVPGGSLRRGRKLRRLVDLRDPLV